jgi:hypothetical protein
LLGLFAKGLNVDAQHGLAVVLTTCISADWVFCKSMEAGSIRKWGDWYPARGIPCNYEAMV